MRAAIIGLGAISPLHINAIQSAGGQVVAACDTDAARFERAIKMAGPSCSMYANYKEMLDREQLDVVHICTPHYLHAEMICECLDRNIHVLCEKPVAINAVQLRLIEEHLMHTRAQLAVCQQNRFNASVRYLKELFRGQEILAASGTLCWLRDASYYNSAQWRGTLLQEGGGVMINQALHTLDLLQWFCGMPRTAIGHGANDTLRGVIDVEESQFGVFTMQNGGRFVIQATNACSHSFPVTIMLRSAETEAVLIGDHMIVNGTFVTRSDGHPLFGKEEWGVGHINLVREYYACLREGKKFPVDFYEARKVVELILALYASQGKEVSIRAMEANCKAVLSVR